MNSDSRRRSRLAVLLALAALAAALVACGDDGPEGTEDATDDTADAGDVSDGGDTGDAQTDTDGTDTGLDVADTDGSDTVDPLIDEWPEVPATTPDEDSDPTAWVPGSDVPEGEARAGIVPEDGSPFSGPESRCREGDYVLANANVAVCVAGLLAPSQYTFTGGYIVDIAPTDTMSGEMLEAIIPGYDLFVVSADEVSVLRDGRDGGEAVVSVTGIDTPLAALATFLADLFRPIGLSIVTEYRLAPDATAVEVVTWLQSDDPEFVRARVAPGDLIISGDHVTAWAPGFGDLGPYFEAETQLWMGVSAGIAYGVWSDALLVASLAPGLLESDIAPTEMTDGVIGPQTVAVFTRYVAAARDTFGVQAAFEAQAGAVEGEETALEGPVDDAHTERRYEITDADGDPVAVVRLDDDGATTATLPSGEYFARWWGHTGDDAITPFTVPTEDPVQLQTPDTGLVRVTVEWHEGDATGLGPALVRLAGPTNLDAYIWDGIGAIAAPPGTYEATVSRGEEYTADIQTVIVPSGGEVALDASVRRTMDTAGWVSGDFHQHARRSIDSAVENTDRVATNLAAGVDFIASTDHDIIDDFPRIVEDMEVGEFIFSLPGIEISPGWGHMNAFPMEYDPTADRFGAVPLTERDGRAVTALNAPELAAAARERGAEVIQVNHPREGSAMFSAAGYDPVLGPDEVNAAFWPGTFQSVEVVNDFDRVCEVMRDWFSLLSRGVRIAGVGNSDTHGFGDPAGWPRNYIASSTDDPAELTSTIITDGLGDLAVSVSGGAFVDFPDGELPGDVLDAVESTFTIRVRVQTPEWAASSTLVTYVNGIEYGRTEITPDGPEDIVDFDDSVSVELERDSYVIFLVYGDTPHPIVTPGKTVFGFTNPVFVDFDGDESWDPPGVSDADDVPWPTDLPFCPGD